jgi:phosphodiesterase/alkaline phosphatase D-like protein
MNKNTMLVGGIVAVVLVAGIAFYATRNNSSVDNTNSTSTTTGDTSGNSTTTTTGTQASTPSAPLVTMNNGATPSDTTVVVTGKVTPNGASTNYWYEYGTNSNSLSGKISSQVVGSGYTAISAPGYITGLTKDTTYYFRLVAENQFGKIASAQSSFQTTHGVPAPVGSIPTAKTLAASNVARTSVTLNGEVTPNNATTQYWFEYGKTTSLGDAIGFVSVGGGNGKVPASVSLTNLDPATTYYFRLDAQNQFGTVISSVLSFKTDGPAVSASAPSVTTGDATSIESSSATLHATVDPNSAVTNYWFEYSTDSLLGSVLIQATAQKSAGVGSDKVSVNADISNLAGKTTYYYRIVAQNSLGTVRGDKESFKTK